MDKARKAFNKVIPRYPKGQYTKEDEESFVVVYYDPSRPLAQALWELSEIAKSRAESEKRRAHIQRITELYPSSHIGLKSFDVLAQLSAEKGDYEGAKAVVLRKIEILRKLESIAKKRDCLMHAADYTVMIEESQKRQRQYEGQSPKIVDDSAEREKDKPAASGTCSHVSLIVAGIILGVVVAVLLLHRGLTKRRAA
jgi:hypothetical protein